MLDLMLCWQPPAATGERCAVATVVGATGSVPRPVGTSMLVSECGEVLGAPVQAASLKDGAGPIHHINTPQHQEMPWT